MFLLPKTVSTVGDHTNFNIDSLIRSNSTRTISNSLFNTERMVTFTNKRNPILRVLDSNWKDCIESTVLNILTIRDSSISNALTPSSGRKIKDTVNAVARFLGEVVDIFTDK